MPRKTGLFAVDDDDCGRALQIARICKQMVNRELWVRFFVQQTWNAKEKRQCRNQRKKTRPKKISDRKQYICQLRPKLYLSKNSPHGGASDEIGAAVLGLVLVHALLGLGGFGLGGHLVLDAVLVRHG